MADPEQVIGAVETAIPVVEALVPGVVPFAPLIALVMTAIKAHYNATQTWPTAEQVQAAIPVDLQAVKDVWAAWDAKKATA